MKRKIWLLTIAATLALFAVRGPAATFELATIKPTPPGTQGGGSGMDPGGRFTAHNASLRGLILFAYGLHPRQLEGGPAWLDTDRFDIEAKADTRETPNKAQLMTMLQKLLADRFSLRLNRETKEIPVYVLTVQSSGHKLTPSTGDPNGLPTARGDPHGHFAATNMSMDEFALGLQGNVLDRPVIDRTGLSGRYDFKLDWNPDESQNSALPGPFTAVKDQLGLKLEATKADLEILIIDHVERPSEN